jgi:hypothetical protein
MFKYRKNEDASRLGGAHATMRNRRRRHAKIALIVLGLVAFSQASYAECRLVGIKAPGGLNPGQSVSHGKLTLIYQADGNLVVYENGRAKWNTRTNGKAAGRFAVQTDRNNVIYGPNNEVWWASNTAVSSPGGAPRVFFVQSSGCTTSYAGNVTGFFVAAGYEFNGLWIATKYL